MANFIEELFYNNINPQARMVRNGSNLQKQMEILADCEERLTSNLTGDDKKAFFGFCQRCRRGAGRIAVG